MPNNIDQELFKKAIKEAITEWLDEKFSTFGKWSIFGILAAALVGTVYLALIGNGWKAPQ